MAFYHSNRSSQDSPVQSRQECVNPWSWCYRPPWAAQCLCVTSQILILYNSSKWYFIKKLFAFYLFCECVLRWVYAHEIRGQLGVVSSLLPLCGPQGLNPGHQTWRQAPLYTEICHQSWPLIPHSIFEVSIVSRTISGLKNPWWRSLNLKVKFPTSLAWGEVENSPRDSPCISTYINWI